MNSKKNATHIRSAILVLGLLLILVGVGGWSERIAYAQANAWETELAKKLGVKLLASLDSSGPDAWDPKKHPLVFVTTEGPGYGGLLSGVKTPGFVIIDAKTRKVVTSRTYDVFKEFGWKDVFEPHGLAVSGDGKWIYLPTGDGATKGRLLIINARTLKIDKVLGLMNRPHHGKTFTTPDGKSLTYVYGWEQPLFVMDPAQDNKVVGGLDFNEMGMEGYLYFVNHRGDKMLASGRIRPGGAREIVHDNVVIQIDTKSWKMIDYMAIGDSTPVWVAFSSDDKFAYVSGGHSSQVFKYDLAAKGLRGLKPVAQSRAGVEGPYGIHFGWDDNFLWAVGKGEGSHNRGKVLGLVSVKLMETTNRPMDQFTTNCIRGDHGTLHPDPDANQLWISCNSSFEVVVFDLDEKKVVDRIPTPNGGSTHSGAFVRYDGWKGQVLSDQNGLHGSALAAKRKILGLTTQAQKGR